MRGEFVGYAFLPLFEEPEASQSLEFLTSRMASTPSIAASCVKPPIGGLAFISTVGEVSDMLDSWWSHAVPPDLLPVLIALHEPGLERWIGERLAARDKAVPLRVLDLERREPCYDEKLVLSRPDQHVAWRGDRLPEDPALLIDRVRGAAVPKLGR